MTDKRASQFGGWLLLFTVQYGLGLAANAVGLIRRLPRVWRLFHGHTALAHSMAPLALGISLLELVVIAAIVWGGVLMLRRDPRTPHYWSLGLVVVFLSNAIGVLLLMSEHRLSLDAGRLTVAPTPGNYVAGVLVSALITVIWVAYWLRATRVARAFAPVTQRQDAPEAATA